MVRLAGLEPARVAPLPPQSSVSANSTIRATGPLMNQFGRPGASAFWPVLLLPVFLANQVSRWSGLEVVNSAIAVDGHRRRHQGVAFSAAARLT